MKEPEYIEGKEAQENFEGGMKAVFKVPKAEVVKVEKQKKRAHASRASTQRKPRNLDKD